MSVSNCLLYDGFFSFAVVRQVVSFSLILTSNSHRNVTDILCFDKIMGWNLTNLWDLKIYCLFFIEFLFSETGQFPKQKLEMSPTENIPSICKGPLLCFHPSFPLCQTHLQVGWPVQSVPSDKLLKGAQLICNKPFFRIFARLNIQNTDFVFIRHCNNSFFDNKNTAVSGDTAGVTNIKCPAPYASDEGVCLVTTFAATNHRPSSNHNSRSLPWIIQV